MSAIYSRSFATRSATLFRAATVALLTVVGFATAAAAEATSTKLRIPTAQVQSGASLRIAGTGWPRLRGVSLYMTRRGAAAKRIKIVRADRRGRFTSRLSFHRVRPGRYTIRACTQRCRRSRRVAFRVVLPAPVPAPPVSQQPPVTAPPPRNAMAEFEQRMKGTRFFDSEHFGDCTSFCSLSEETQRFCADGTWTDDSQESGISNFRSHQEGTWRVVSATLGDADAPQGEVMIVFGENSDAVVSGVLAPGHTKTVPIVFDGAGSASIDGRGYAVSLPGIC